MYNKIVTINLTSKCNAKCDHCCFSCSPQSTIKMENDYIIKLVKEFCENETIETISFTGGEIFLDYEFLLKLYELILPYGKAITVISNGFWGGSKRLVEKYFNDMKKYNVQALTISHDEFHKPFVKTNNVKNILKYAQQVDGISVSLSVAVTKDKMSNNILKELDDAILGIAVTKFPLIDVGEAKHIEPSSIHSIYNLDNKVALNCPGYEVVYHHDGEIYPCCSPGIFETKLSLRYDENQSFDDTVNYLYTNLLLYIIRKESFNWFINILEKNQMLEEFNIKNEFSSICSICKNLFDSEEKIQYFIPYMKEYQYENFKVRG
ncbi:YydG family peptide radical SAM peptide maturase [Macrococcoides caseolyticum]|uniref:YydG family radical SAM peptide epimerase n=1 Tax=Macrococcoides caseolyticum TaxID=69966 RepID=UPI000A295B0A|nr:YydG family radical SAM peptide epimerase [Macrococcus caseolyticus]ARQ05161.1 molybdenum cofactor biosynthesis protein A [Macrococcus caseolyticus]PKE05723.1 YydG family peptide radical SAM peptide maturase [Macrococcus caseolyticus]PKE22918.1 YydG family peptide radical SAM peptide maturase [Macrococcus caseolyticus]PKE51847.1 YydG family peptide radical SAM peptide maturase [Macrococcus caseolyticus]PKF37427.1 YydG family peptide radical SAM peptide maturase [Macrococcus caseolyticus]